MTEGGRSSLFVFLEGCWVTPALDSGLLPGVMRAQLIHDWSAKELRLKPEDLYHAQRVVVASALRGVLDARLYNSENFSRGMQ